MCLHNHTIKNNKFKSKKLNNLVVPVRHNTKIVSFCLNIEEKNKKYSKRDYITN